MLPSNGCIDIRIQTDYHLIIKHWQVWNTTLKVEVFAPRSNGLHFLHGSEKGIRLKDMLSRSPFLIPSLNLRYLFKCLSAMPRCGGIDERHKSRQIKEKASFSGGMARGEKEGSRSAKGFCNRGLSK